MQKLPVNIFNIKQFSTTHELYTKVSSLLGIQRSKIQIFYKKNKIPSGKERFDIEIPEIGYEYGDNFEFTKLENKMPPIMIIQFKNTQKLLKLDSKLISKEINISGLQQIISKLIHTPSQNIDQINQDNNSRTFKLKEGLSLYEVNFVNFEEVSAETEYYCLKDNSNIDDLQAIVAKRHKLMPEQIEYFQNKKSESKSLNETKLSTFPNENIFCFRFVSQNKKEGKISNIKLKANVHIGLDNTEISFNMNYDSTIGDLRKKIIEEKKCNHCFGIVIENEFISNQRNLSHFIIDPNSINQITTIHSQNKCCDIFKFMRIYTKTKIKRRLKKNEKDIKNTKKTETKSNTNKIISCLLPLDMNIQKVIETVFTKNHPKELYVDNKMLKYQSKIGELNSSKIIGYNDVICKYYYKDLKEKSNSIDIKSSSSISRFLQKLNLSLDTSVCVKFENKEIPFWKKLSEFQNTDKNPFELVKKSVTFRNLEQDKTLAKPQMDGPPKYNIYSDFIQLKNENFLFFSSPISGFYQKIEVTDQQKPEKIYFLTPSCLKIEFTEIDKNPLDFVKIRFDISDTTFKMFLEYSNEKFDLPLDFSASCLPNNSNIHVTYTPDESTYAQVFCYNSVIKKHKNKQQKDNDEQSGQVKLIIYDETTTIDQLKEILQKEFKIYQYPISFFSFYFGECEIKPTEIIKAKELFKRNYINPKATVELKIQIVENADYRPVNVSTNKEIKVFYFQKDAKKPDVEKCIESQFKVPIYKITDEFSNIVKDEIPNSIKVFFKQIKISYCPFGENDYDHFRKGIDVRSVIKKLKSSSSTSAKFKDFKCGVFLPNTNICLDGKQTLSLFKNYNFYRYVTVKFNCKYLKTDEKNPPKIIFNETFTLGDIKNYFSPFVLKGNKLNLVDYDTYHYNDETRLGDVMKYEEMITVSIEKISRNTLTPLKKPLQIMHYESKNHKDQKVEKSEPQENQNQEQGTNASETSEKDIKSQGTDASETSEKDIKSQGTDASETSEKDIKSQGTDASETSEKDVKSKGTGASTSEASENDGQSQVTSNENKVEEKDGDDDDDSDTDSSNREETKNKEVEIVNYTFKLTEGTVFQLQLPSNVTVADAREEIAKYLNEHKTEEEDESDDDEEVEGSSVDILFAGKTLRSKMTLDSLNLEEGEELNVFVRKTTDIFLLTCKALRFTKEDLEKAAQSDYEYEYEEEEEND